jgi:hypothetical protein
MNLHGFTWYQQIAELDLSLKKKGFESAATVERVGMRNPYTDTI